MNKIYTFLLIIICLVFGEPLYTQTAQALDFDGVDDFVASNANVGISGNAARTLECWVNPTLTNLFNEHIINWGGAPSDGQSFGFYQTFGSELRFYGFGGTFDFNTGFVFDGNWHHVAVTYNGSHVRVYVDGNETPTSNQAVALNTIDSRLFMGVREAIPITPTANTYAALKMDEVRVWNRALSSFEINETKDCELQGNESGLVLYYNFNRGTPSGNNAGVTTMPDMAGSNNATLSNFSLSGGSSNWVTGSPVTNSCCESASTPTISASQTSICLGESVTISITSGTLNQNDDWVWYSGADISSCGSGTEEDFGVTSITVFPTTTTFYSVRGEDGCAPAPGACAGINITVNALPTATATSNSPVCAGETLMLSESAGTGVSYSWFGPNNFSSSSKSPTINNVNTLRTGTYSVSITDVNGCTAMDEVEVTIHQVETIGVEVENTACEGSPLNLATTETNENIEFYSWTGPNNFSSSLTFPTIANASSLNSGTYSVTVTYETGCTASASQSITISPTPMVEITTNAPTCIGDNLMVETIGGGPADDYNWTGPDNFSSTNPNFNISNLTTVNEGTYNLIITNGSGCETNESINLDLVTLPEASLSNSGPFCAGEPVLTLTATATTAYTYNWENQTSGTNYEGAEVTITNPVESDGGNYMVTITNEEGCTSVENINVGYNGAIPQLEITGNSSVCVGNSITLSETGNGGTNHQWTGPNGFQASGTSIELTNTSNLNAGLYQVTADNGNGCEAEAAFELSVNSLPTVVFDISDNMPCEGTTVQIAENGGNLTNWNWTGPNNFSSTLRNPVISNIEKAGNGTYTLMGTDVNGCVGEGEFNLSVQTVFNAGTGRNIQICSGAIVDLNILIENADPTGQFIDEDGAGTLNGSILTTDNLTSGDYRFTYTLAGNSTCITSTTVLVRVQEILSAGADVSLTECQGASIDLSSVLSNADEMGFFLDQGNSGGLAGTTFNTANLAAGTYEIIYRVGEGSICPVDEAILSIEVVALPETPTFPELIYCGAAAITLTAPVGENYQWSNGANTASIVVSPLSTTNYGVTVTNSTNCSVSGEAIVQVGTIEPLILAEDATICRGENHQLSTSGGTNFQWTPEIGLSDATISNPVATPIESTTYEVLVSNDLGCTNTGTISIIVNETPETPILEASTICAGETVVLSATEGTVYAWSNGANNQTISVNPLADTNYGVTVTNEFNCSVNATALITVNQIPELEVTNNATICAGSTLQLNASGGSNYNWSPAIGLDNATISSPIASPTINTTYEVIAESEAGCTDTGTVSVIVNASPETPVLEASTICAGETVTLSATKGTVYAWSNGANNQTISVNPLESTDYTVTVTNEFNCSVNAAATITVNEIPDLVVTNNTSICQGSTVQLNASGGSTYNWLPALGLDNSAIANPIANPTENTTYEVTAATIEGCSTTAQVNIIVNELPLLQVGTNASICVGESTILQASGTGTFQWTPAIGLDNPSSNTPLANPETSTDYSVLLTDENGCTNMEQLTVEVRTLPEINLGADMAICEGAEITLTASGGGTYLWETIGGIESPSLTSQTVSPTELTTYSVAVVGENECSATDEITIKVNANPVADAGVDQSTCVGVEAILTADGGGTYQWSNNLAGAIISVSPEMSTNYTVTVTNEDGCTDTDEVFVTIAEDFEVMVSPDTFYCLGGNAQLSAEGGAIYTWSPALGLNETTIANPTANPEETTLYEVEIKDEMGCIVKKTVEIEVKEVDNFSLTEDQDLCEGNTVSLSVTGGVTYTWSPAIAFSDPSLPDQAINPSSSATYQVSVIDEFGCTMSDSVNVMIRPIPEVSAIAVEELCEGDTLNLIAEGTDVQDWLWEGVNYTATEQAPSVQNIEGNQGGDYTVTGTSEFGCMAKDTILVQVNAAPVINIAAPEMICENMPLSLTENGGADITTWEWSGVGGASFSGANWDLGLAQTTFSGSYQLTVKDANSCTNTEMVTIQVNPAANAGMDTLVAACQGTTIELSNLLIDSDPDGIYEPGFGLTGLNGTSINTQELEERTYEVTYTVTSEGCPDDEAKIEVKIETTKSAGLDNSENACQGIAIELTDLLQEADGGGVFSEIIPSNALSGNILNTDLLDTGTYAIEYTVGLESSCGMDQATLNIVLAEQVKAGTDAQTDLCQMGNFDLTTILSGATDGGEFIDLSGSNALNGSILTAEDLPFGDYLFDYRVQSSNDCPSDSARIEVTIKDILTAGMDSEATFCTGEAIELTDLLVEADAGGVFNPIGEAPNEFTGDGFETKDLGSTIYNFEYVVGGTEGCPEDKISITVNLNQSPSLELVVPDSFFCIGDSIELAAIASDGTGGLSFQWDTPSGILSNPMITASEAGNYRALVLDENNCEATASTTLTSNIKLEIEIEGKVEVCQNEELVLQSVLSGEAFNYAWILPDGKMINDSMLNLEATEIVSGEYLLQVTDAFSCTQETSTTVMISAGEFFQSNFLTANIACTGDTLHFIEITERNLSPTASFEWDFGDGQGSTERDPVHNFQSPGLYPVVVEINDQNCGNISFEKELNIVSCRKNIFDQSPFDYLNLFPNPSSGLVYLELDLNRREPVRIEVFDLYGKRVKDKVLENGLSFQGALEFSEAGIYFVHFYTFSGKKVMKLVVE